MKQALAIQTKRNRKQYCTVKLIKEVRQVTFFNVKIEKFGGDNSRQSCAFLVSGAGWLVEFNFKCPNTAWQQ